MATWEFERVAGPFGRTEGPVWNGSILQFTDIPNDVIYAFDPTDGSCKVAYTDTNGAIGMALGPDAALYVCEGGARRVVRYEPGGRRHCVAATYQEDRLNRPNDLVFDASGRLWFTDNTYGMAPEDRELDHESVYRIDPQHRKKPERMTFDTRKPNGILISRSQEYLFVADSPLVHRDQSDGPPQLRAYPIEPDETLGEYEVIHDYQTHRGIDGMCLDEDGNILAAAGSEDGGPGPRIDVFAENGELLDSHPVPTSAPTNCAFGGPDLRTLYATDLDGYLLRSPLDRTGLEQPQQTAI